MKRWMLFLVGVPTFLLADSFDAGAVFLLIFPGARATGMGAAFSAIADDATASYFNPASVGTFSKPQFSLVHSPWLRELAPDMYYDFMGAVYPLPNNRGVIGGHIIYLNLGRIELTEPVPASWNPFSVALQVSYARHVLPNLYVGIGGKVIYDFLAPVDVLRAVYQTNVEGGNAATVALDGGVLYHAPYNISLSAALLNLGPGLRYTSLDTVGTPIPELLRIGVGIDTTIGEFFRIRAALDLHKVIVGILEDYRTWGIDTILKDTWVSVGMGITYARMISLRVGYFLDETGARKGVTFGGGIQVGNFSIDFADDRDIYAFTSKSANLRFQISYTLNPPASPTVAPPSSPNTPKPSGAP